jgi:hypothetical protein
MRNKPVFVTYDNVTFDRHEWKKFRLSIQSLSPNRRLVKCTFSHTILRITILALERPNRIPSLEKSNFMDMVCADFSRKKFSQVNY